MSTTRNRRDARVVEDVWLSQPDPVGSWLDVLMGLVRLPPAERRSIRDELDSHLRDRVRDIMLTGLDEVSATREAIAELGDAAELATRYGRASRAPARRRLAMNIGMLGVACAALVTSVVALNGETQPAGMSVYPGEPAIAQERVPVGALRVENAPLAEVLSRVAAGAGKRLTVDWNSLAPLGLETVTEVTLDMAEADLASIFDAINAIAVRGDVPPEMAREGQIAFRVGDGVLRVASAHVFDRADRVIATIDISSVLERGVEADEITWLVMSFIEPDQWVENGGDISTMSIVGGKMFIKAPPRVIEGVRWIVGELSSDEEAAGPGADAAWKRNELVPAPERQGMRTCMLAHSGATEMSKVVEMAMQVSPSLHELRGGRSVVADPRQNTLILLATGGDIDRIERLVRELDAAPIADKAVSESRTIRLRSAKAAEVRAFLGNALGVNPALKECLVARVFEVDASDNTLTVSATPGQVEAISRIVEILDG